MMQSKLKQAVNLVTTKHNVLLLANHNNRQKLIKQLFNQLSCNIHTCLIDFAQIKDNADIIACFYQGISATLAQSSTNKAKQHNHKLTQQFITSDMTLHQCCKALIAKHGFAAVIDFMIAILSDHCQAHDCSHTVIAIDAFEMIQNIKTTKLDATLRTIGQQNTWISFVFTGEPKHLMPLFGAYQQPLYGSTTTINVLEH